MNAKLRLIASEPHIGRNDGTIAWLTSAKNELRQEVLDTHAACAEALASGDKDFVRGLHHAARAHGEAICGSHEVLDVFEKRKEWFKHGREIDIRKIRPVLKSVESTEDSQLWTLARACWSMPYSKGYGRRLRFLVIDEEHQGLIGVLGLQSPPADLRCRDQLFKYPVGGKLELVNQTMDAYTIGAIPPYSFLLGGKLCAGLLASDSIREAYWRKYAAKNTKMRGKIIQQPLVAITTTSAFGRSSVYNRLRYKDRILADTIGYTKGYGMLHLEHLYPKMTSLLRAEGSLTPNGYGNGPKVRWQNATKALMSLGLPLDLLSHGVQREVFLFRLVEDLERGMAGEGFGAPLRLHATDFSNYWLERWCLPRAERYPTWNEINSRSLIKEKVKEWSDIAISA